MYNIRSDITDIPVAYPYLITLFMIFQQNVRDAQTLKFTFDYHQLYIQFTLTIRLEHITFSKKNTDTDSKFKFSENISVH